MIRPAQESYVSTQNPCTLCTPFGATLALAGIDRAMPLLHGSQGCSTYIRRFLIGHFREPMDVSCSNFSEQTAVFGGRDNLLTALGNVTRTYRPSVIGVATTCLAETIGDDVPAILREFRETWDDGPVPALVPVSTPSYRGTYTDGFHAAVRQTLAMIAQGDPGPDCPKQQHINLFPNMVSPGDLRHLRQVCEDFDLDVTMLPDYADRMDGPAWEDYQRIPEGGTPIEQIRRSGRASVSLELSSTLEEDASPASLLSEKFNVPKLQLPLPIGIRATDRFFATLSELSGLPVPAQHTAERGRLLDAYVDGHKYLFDMRAVVYGEEDLVAAIAGFLTEIGVIPVLCASGGRSGRLGKAVRAACGDRFEGIEVLPDGDFVTIEERARELSPDILIGNSNGAKVARKLNVPLVRVGMPIHDRVGAARVRTLGYGGTQELFDRLCNAVIERTQESNSIGYTHM